MTNMYICFKHKQKNEKYQYIYSHRPIIMSKHENKRVCQYLRDLDLMLDIKSNIKLKVILYKSSTPCNCSSDKIIKTYKLKIDPNKKPNLELNNFSLCFRHINNEKTILRVTHPMIII